MANFSKNTRYTGGKIAKTRDNKDFLVLRRQLNLSRDSGDVIITVTQDLEKRPDLISQKAYNTPDLWWAIYEFNNIKDPLFDVVAGMELRIPELERVLQAIQELEQDI